MQPVTLLKKLKKSDLARKDIKKSIDLRPALVGSQHRSAAHGVANGGLSYFQGGDFGKDLAAICNKNRFWE